jgi:DNA-binding NtrC family response regulator
MMRVLVVDDEVEVGRALGRLLRRQFDVELARNAEEALSKLDAAPFDVVLCDFRMPGMNGADLLREVKRRQPGVRRVLVSGYADLSSGAAPDPGEPVWNFLRKPWSREELLAALEP